MDEEFLRRILQERKEYYNQVFAVLEMIKCLNHRELAFLSVKGYEKKRAFRYMWSSTLDYFKKHTAFSNFYEHPVNVYRSVATLKSNVPIFTYNLKERKKQDEYIDFNLNFEKYVEKFDLFFDFDGKEDFNKCYADAKFFKTILDEYKVPYFVQNSSKTGFHFIIPADYMPSFSLSLINDISYVIKRCIKDYGIESLDNSVTDLKRLSKCPYSYSCDGSIVFPLTDYQFNNFNTLMVEYKYVMKNFMLKNRGLQLRTYGLSLEELQKNVEKFIYDHKN